MKINSHFAFYDRGIHDIYAYLKANNKDSKFWYNRVSVFQYDLVFLLAPWKEIYTTDYQSALARSFYDLNLINLDCLNYQRL